MQLLTPQTKDLGGGFTVRRLLPQAACRAVGPFIFFDHFGPITAQPSDNHDVRPHPHIGLATVTYLFEGAMLHRDSLGNVQRIEPGAINWMSAGRGIVHSERTPDDLRGVARRSHGLQLWVALPADHEEDAPSFAHTPADALPALALPGVAVRVLVGRAFGAESPVRTASPTLYLDLAFEAGAALELPGGEDTAGEDTAGEDAAGEDAAGASADAADAAGAAAGAAGPAGGDVDGAIDPAASAFGRGAVPAAGAPTERAVYSVDAAFELDGVDVPPCTLALLAPGSRPLLRATGGAARIVLVGGAPLGPRFIAWNFVSSRAARIRQAQGDWEAGRFDPVPGETEFIPLPARQPL